MPRWADGHLDLAYLGLRGLDIRQPIARKELACVSLPALREAGIDLVWGTIYTEPAGPESADPWCYPTSDDLDAAEGVGLKQLAFYEQLEAEREIVIVRTRVDLDAPSVLPKVVILMEGADPVRSSAQIPLWFERGVRAIGLSWARGTRYAGGDAAPGPLTDSGRDLVRAMDQLGIIHDVSHLADDAFDSLVEETTGPIVATHSNCRALLEDSQRHLRDSQIQQIALRGGVIGINLFSRFLSRGRRATVNDVIAHIEHVCHITGDRKHVALGSDMDGGFLPSLLPQDVDHPRHLERIASALAARGWTEAEIRSFASENWMRFLRQSLPR